MSERPVIEGMPLGHDPASVRLLAARGSIYAAFDSLACGMDHDEALRYMQGSPHFQALPESERGKVVGLALGFAIVAVEGDRRLRKRGQWFRLGKSEERP